MTAAWYLSRRIATNMTGAGDTGEALRIVMILPGACASDTEELSDDAWKSSKSVAEMWLKLAMSSGDETSIRGITEAKRRMDECRARYAERQQRQRAERISVIHCKLRGQRLEDTAGLTADAWARKCALLRDWSAEAKRANDTLRVADVDAVMREAIPRWNAQQATRSENSARDTEVVQATAEMQSDLRDEMQGELHETQRLPRLTSDQANRRMCLARLGLAYTSTLSREKWDRKAGILKQWLIDALAAHDTAATADVKHLMDVAAMYNVRARARDRRCA